MIKVKLNIPESLFAGKPFLVTEICSAKEGIHLIGKEVPESQLDKKYNLRSWISRYNPKRDFVEVLGRLLYELSTEPRRPFGICILEGTLFEFK